MSRSIVYMKTALPQTPRPAQTPRTRNLIFVPGNANAENALTPVDKRIHIPDGVFAALALPADKMALAPLLGGILVEEVLVDLHDAVLHGADEGLLHADVREVVVEELAEGGHLFFDGVADRVDEFAAVEVAFVDEPCRQGRGHLGCPGVDEVVDDGAQAAVQLDLGVEHVLDDSWYEPVADKAHEIARVEQAAAFAQFPECAADAGEIELDFWGDIFDVERDDLLF